ncbi:carbohydrate porin [Bradyrhizobium sp. WSM2254]|uniref:carbohydrate porin n=1 Tax=Bradyrhizobium sp. WSM2254 TaxID=1188263 RepID=UPI001FDA2F41|nr:carbohydrate porin [Bradyrhizobium sp. WSM2254]
MERKLSSFPARTLTHVPPKAWQFAKTRDEEVIFEITGIGPTTIESRGLGRRITCERSLLTAVYQYQIRDGWTLQPNFQYIIHPGGGATNPSGPLAGTPLKNASVFGLRTTLKF